MRATQAYHEVTARTLGPQTMEWIDQLASRFGDERVAQAILDDSASGKPLGQLLGRVRDRLAREDAVRRPRPAPVELSGQDVLAVVRGEAELPGGDFIWDSRDLTADEYGEVLAFGPLRRGEAARV